MFKLLFETKIGRACVCGLAVAGPSVVVWVLPEFFWFWWFPLAFFFLGGICWFLLGGEASIRRHIGRLKASQPPDHLRGQRITHRH